MEMVRFKNRQAKPIAVMIKLVLLIFFIIFCYSIFLYFHYQSLMTITREVMSKGEEIKRHDKPSFSKNIGLVNMEDEDVKNWTSKGHHVFHLAFQRVSSSIRWDHLATEHPCPEIPLPSFDEYEDVDMIVVKLPCGEKDVFRLQVHLVAANLAVKKGKWDMEGTMEIVFIGKCPPMIEIFRCDDAVVEEREQRLYRPEKWRLEQKIALPVGPCALSLPFLWENGKKLATSYTGGRTATTAIREAYATMLHSSEGYVCGAIVLAQTLIRTGTKRDLILLHDNSIYPAKLSALSRAGWKLRSITRIRYPRAKEYSHNEYNYSKLRLWQLTDYDKVVYMDSDVVVLRNLDILFNFPQMSATWDQGFVSDSVFNSGVMVIEPSNCTFLTLMSRIRKIESYNGGDQGFLNENFIWWHQLPSRVSLLSFFWSNSSLGEMLRNRLLTSVPQPIRYYDDFFNNFWCNNCISEPDYPAVYAIHYVGFKPWLCYRDYDCNWDDSNMKIFAKDEAFAWWWRVYDGIKDELKRFCGLTEQMKMWLEYRRKEARDLGLRDLHWRMNITDPRKFNAIGTRMKI